MAIYVNKRQFERQQRFLKTAFALSGRLFPHITSRYACQLWFRAPRFQSPGRELKWLQHATLSVIHHRGLPITVYEWGEGPVVLLVHGWSGRALQLGAIAMALSRNGFKAVAIDLPAHGKTPGTHTNAFEMAAAIDAVMQHFSLVNGIVTHSYGVLPVSMLLRQGVQINRLVCVSPPDNQEYLFSQFVQAMHYPPTLVKHLRRRIEQVLGEGVWDELAADKNVAGLNLPALIVHDDKDADVAVQCGETLAQAWPGASFCRTNGLGHRRILRDNEIIQRVCRFIAGEESS